VDERSNEITAAGELWARNDDDALDLNALLHPAQAFTGFPLSCFFRNTKACRTRMSYYGKGAGDRRPGKIQS
jgi:hypothetical protein